jgi:EF hand domain-containing protein
MRNKTVGKAVLGATSAMLLASTTWAADPGDTTQAISSANIWAVFAQLDTDRDGRISAIEAANDPRVAAAFTQLDTNRDGYLTMQEFAQIARMSSDTGAETRSGSPPPSDAGDR